jgi:hypothetical protein
MITIEKIRTYVPIAEKIAMADKIVNYVGEPDENKVVKYVIGENGIVDKNMLKIASTCFFVAAYCQVDETDYDEIIQNNIHTQLCEKLQETNEFIEWDTILANAVENVVETRKNHMNNVMGAITSLLNSLNKKVEKFDLEKALKMILKAMKNPDAAKNIKEYIDLAKDIKNQNIG